MMLFDEVGYVFFKGLCLLFFQNIPVAMFIQEAMLIPESRVAFKESTSQYSYKLSTFELWLELAWLGAKCNGKTLQVIEFFFTLHSYCTVIVQYLCSVFKAKHDQVFSLPC